VLVGVDELVNEEALDVVVSGHDLLVAGVGGDVGARKLQSVQRALAGERVPTVAFDAALLAQHVSSADRGGK